MSIEITNSGYLAQAVKNRPIVGWHSVVVPSGFSSDDTATGSSASNMWSPDTYTFWESTPLSESSVKYIVFTIPAEEEINYFTVVGHDIGRESGTPAVTLQYSDDGVSWFAVPGSTVSSIIDGSPILSFFNGASATIFRLGISVFGGGLSTIKIAHIRVGTALVLERPYFVGYSPFTRDVEKLTNRSDSGRYLGSTLVSEVRQYNVDQQHNSDAFVREYIEPFLEHCQLIGGGGSGPKGSFVLAWRPEEFPDDVYYCADPDSVTWPSYSRPNKAIGLDWSISGVAEK